MFKVTDATGALKVMKFAKAPCDPGIQGEYEALQNMSHPNLPRVYSILKFGDIFGYEMDFQANGDLHDRIWSVGGAPNMFEEKELASVAHGVVCALCMLHSKQFVHRDVKPPNILLDHGMRPLLADFGCGRRLVDPRTGLPERAFGMWGTDGDVYGVVD